MAMSRKNYVDIAAELNDSATLAHNMETPAERFAALELLDHVARRIANACWKDNPRFDRARFLKACGIGEE